MTDQLVPIAIHHALPLNSENRWSDVLAVLIETDPGPICELLDLGIEPSAVAVKREVSLDKANRPDLILHANGSTVAVIEVKLLSGLGVKQLDRYLEAEPNAGTYVAVYPRRLTLDLRHAEPWMPLTWEQILEAYSRSSHGWVAATASAWTAHLEAVLPKVSASTVWNDMDEGGSFPIAIRARMAWLHAHLGLDKPLETELLSSSAGGSWVLRMFSPAKAPGYRVLVDVEEGLARGAPKVVPRGGSPAKGPVVKVVLLQHGVDTSANFDWEYLLAMWPAMAKANVDWSKRTAVPKSQIDRAGYQAMVAAGGPKYLGFGFGDAQTRQNGECMFGAKFQIAPDRTLAAIKDTLESLGEVLREMAEVERPTPTGAPEGA